MKKGKVRSEVSLPATQPITPEKEEIFNPLDVLIVKILCLRVPDEEVSDYAIKVTFVDQIIVTGVIKSIGARQVVKNKTIVKGIMSYDPSDYERMCLFADYPLIVNIQPMKSVESYLSGEGFSITESSTSVEKCINDISWCNIDILPLFTDRKIMNITKHLEPIVPPTILGTKSWNNLPQITMAISVTRNKANMHHHKVLQQANCMKITLIGAYNMYVPFQDESVYTAASKSTTPGEMNGGLITFNQGYQVPKRFSNTSFYPKWESLRIGDSYFTKCSEKFECKIEDLQNEYNIDLNHYLKKVPKCYTTLWGSFHRSMLFRNFENELYQNILRYNWPFEVHIYSECGGYSFMAFLDLFRLLYPGENVVRLVTPLQWINSSSMMEKCGCENLLTPNDKMSSAQATVKKPSKVTTDSAPTSTSTELGFLARPTGGDDTNAFIIVEVKLNKPLKDPIIPPHIPMLLITDMLKQMEKEQIKRECTGRGQLNRNWQYTVRCAANSLRRIPYYGMTDICAINRQLSETRNRVEMITSFWQDAAIYVNNNFVPQEFLSSNELYEEMLMIAHVCLMRTTYDALVGVDSHLNSDPVLQASRHARQLKDIPHAVDLLLQLIVDRPRDADIWRELATCFKEMDRDWAVVCINKSIILNPRHPLTILSKGCMVFEENANAAEPFFMALLSLCPFWTPIWVAANAYFLHRQMFHIAQEIMNYAIKISSESLEDYNKFPRTWEAELGDWWDHTPLLPGTSLYYEAADLLLRIRAITLAEVCMARALCETGDTAAYYHLVALCCRLRKDPTSALCHLHLGIAKFGDISYLRSLEGECHHKLKNIPASIASFEKAGSCSSAYSVLLSLSRRDSKRMRTVLVDIIRRQPNAYAWMTLADDWMMRSASGEYGDAGKSDDETSALKFAMACAVQALKWDRNAGRAWALLSKLAKPIARRQYCTTMAIACGYNKWSEIQQFDNSGSRQSLCHRLGVPLRECRCGMCEHLAF